MQDLEIFKVSPENIFYFWKRKNHYNFKQFFFNWDAFPSHPSVLFIPCKGYFLGTEIVVNVYGILQLFNYWILGYKHILTSEDSQIC